jgi:hypothetical protein
MTSVEVWDPATSRWTEVASLPISHHNETNSAVVLANGRVLLAGAPTPTPSGGRCSALRRRSSTPERAGGRLGQPFLTDGTITSSSRSSTGGFSPPADKPRTVVLRHGEHQGMVLGRRPDRLDQERP